jgi:c-di-GMP-related signal transduction protein
MVNSFTGIGIREVGDRKKCFINFTENLLLNRVPTYISPEYIVVEILENVNLTQEILNVCKELKSKGYIIALDDVAFKRNLSTLLPYIDIKIDYLAMDRKDIKDMVEEYEDQVTFLAEKIESREEYEKMKDIIEDLPLTNELAHALLGNHEKYNRALATVKSIEQGDWDELQTLCSTLQTSDAELYVYYQASTRSADKFVSAQAESTV